MAQVMITQGFFDELIKIAEAYRAVRGVEDRLRKDIPVLSLGKKVDPEKAVDRITKAIESSKAKVLGHDNIAVRTQAVPSLERLGFKPTRLAVPLPGERGLAPVSYRRGRIHAHRMGDFTLMHHDKIAPAQGMVQAIQHWFQEGLPASVERIKADVIPPVQYQSTGQPQ